MYQASAQETLVAPSNGASRLDRLAAVGLPLLACALFVLSTHHGIGILPDSTRYMGLGARPWDAPGYPMLLQVVAATGIDIVAGAWGIGLVLAALNAWMAWAILREATGRSSYAALGGLLIVVAPQTVAFHSVAMSEPLFVATILATVLALMRYLRTAEPRWLVVVGLTIGLASLVRFTGPPLGAAVALFLLIDPRHAMRRRIGNVVRVLVPSASLFLGWMMLSEWLIGHSTGRALAWYGNMSAADWLTGFTSLTAWIVPDEVPFTIRAALFLMAAAATLLLLTRHSRRMLAMARDGKADPGLIAIPLGFFFFAYLGFFALAASIEANLCLNSRYAYPIYCTSIIMATIVVSRAKTTPGWIRQVHGALVGLAMFMLVSDLLRTADRTHHAYREGLGYASLAWTRSPTLQAVRRLPPDAVLYSNGADAIGFVLRRQARNIPAHVLLRTGRDDPAFPFTAQLAETGAALARGNAYVVFLNRIDWRFYMASEAELARRLNLRLVTRQKDGSIYQARQTDRATSGE